MKSRRGLRTGWPVSRLVLLAGLTLAGAMLAALVLMFTKEREHAIDEQRARAVMYARVLEDHVTRSVDTAALSIANLAKAVADQGQGGGASSPVALQQMLISLPQLRAMAVLGKDGRVHGSSVPGEIGLKVDMARLGPLPPMGKDALGPYVAGRSLGDLALGRPASAAPQGVGFVPLLRHTSSRDGDRVVVALIHPEGLATLMRLTVQEPGSNVYLSDYAGALITSTTGLAPGLRLAASPVFRDFLPATEHASYRGAGVEPGEQTAAFRVSRTRPLVVIVERSVASVVQDWFAAARGRAITAGLGVLAVLLLSWTAARSLRARELGHRHLDEAQAQVARSERELSVIVRSVQELLFRTDTAGVLTFVNTHWAAAGGGLIDTLIGRDFAALVAADEQPDVRRIFDAAASTGVRRASVTLWAAQGAPRRFDLAVVPLLNGTRVVGFAGSGVDITERLLAEKKLKTQLAFTEQLMDVSPLPKSVTDLDGRYVFVNRAWEDFTGQRRSDVIGRVGGAHLPAGLRAANFARDHEVVATGLPARYEIKFPHQDGSHRDAVVSKLPVPGEDGRPAGVLSLVFDVTEFREAERATREARDAAEESSRAKSEFVANISHELRTPLQSIMGFSELGTLRARGNDKLGAMFGDILASGRRMLALVNDLLDVSKIESAVGAFHLERTDVRPLLREVQRELAPLVSAKRMALHLALPAHPMAAKVDPLRFQQVVRNTLANAIKFSPEGSEILLHGDTDDSGAVRVSVRDHGPGIPPNEVEKIFEAFVQSSKTKDGSGGTGLGLAICRKIVQAHGGTIAAENMPGGGSRFNIVFPLIPAGETQPAELDA